MLFSSVIFLCYFLPAVLVLYYLLFFSRTAQNILLLLSSLLFYAWGEPVYILLMLFSILFNSLMGYLVQGERKGKRFFLIAALVCNLGMLFVFKYLTFLLKSVGVRGFSVSLPIGISFYTFQALSYVVDVYWGKVKAENPFYVGLYISFFPQLIAGPILTYSTVAEQIRHRKESWDGFCLGACRFVAGLGKKVLLSNNFAAIADNVFAWSAIGTERLQVPAMLAWVGSIAYTLQIYFDFSGYSDMAIGLGAMFGFRFPENFNYPYAAVSITDFWRRWHISLTSWFREYVYIPLGGNRHENKDIMVRNLFLVWLLTGIWHGANWTFLLWGLFYFLVQLTERFFGYAEKIPGPIWNRVYTLLIVNFAWVVFRADDLYQAGRFLLNMLGLNRNGLWSDVAVLFLRENWVFFLAGIFFSAPVARMGNEYLYKTDSGLNRLLAVCYPAGMLLLLVTCIAYLASGSYNPFIYFNF